MKIVAAVSLAFLVGGCASFFQDRLGDADREVKQLRAQLALEKNASKRIEKALETAEDRGEDTVSLIRQLNAAQSSLSDLSQQLEVARENQSEALKPAENEVESNQLLLTAILGLGTVAVSGAVAFAAKAAV